MIRGKMAQLMEAELSGRIAEAPAAMPARKRARL